ncbi:MULTISPECIES: SdpI family protein [Bacillaceae]|uniref:SdpI family protein n=1 Tax=Bacillaceae TaxID=186817 RepID=UPI002FFEE50E
MKKYWFGLVLLLLSLIVTFISYPYLPEKIAIHWNYKGVPDDYSNRSFGLFLLPGIMIIFYLLTIILPKIDPKKSNFKRFQGSYFKIMNGLLLFLFLFQVVQITSSLGIVNPKYIVPELVGLLFIFIGNLSPKFKPNYFVGIRTPWTLANEDVWKKTHRFGGKVFVITGLLLLFVPVVPTAIQAYFVLSVIIISLALIVGSSYYFFIKL